MVVCTSHDTGCLAFQEGIPQHLVYIMAAAYSAFSADTEKSQGWHKILYYSFVFG